MKFGEGVVNMGEFFFCLFLLDFFKIGMILVLLFEMF